METTGKPNIMDIIQAMKDQIANCDYKPTVAILRFDIKVNAFKIKNKPALNSQIKRVLKLFRSKFKTTVIDKIEYMIGFDGDDFINGMSTVHFILQVH